MNELENKLKELIENGDEIIKKCFKAGSFGREYYEGELYEEWMSNCKILLNKHFVGEPLVEEFKEASSQAIGGGIGNYDKMKGILKALFSNIKLLETSIDKIETKNKKVFISHSSKDRIFTDKFVDLLKIIGLKDNQMYYSSYEETGTDFLEDCLDRIKREFQSNQLIVLFMLSANFYNSNICMAEMGATWVTSEDDYIPILLPPYDYNNIKGVIKNTQNSMMIHCNDISNKLEQFKNKIENFFNIENKVSATEWQRQKEQFIEHVKEKLKSYEEVEANIEEIMIDSGKVILKIKLKNNTKSRLRFEDISININIKDGKEIEKNIDDWTVTSIVLQPLESLTFLTSFENEFELKKSKILTQKCSVKDSFYIEN